MLTVMIKSLIMLNLLSIALIYESLLCGFSFRNPPGLRPIIDLPLLFMKPYFPSLFVAYDNNYR